MTVDVLGTKYTITQSDKLEDIELEKNDGYCDHSTKQIVIDTFKDSPGSLADLDEYKKQVIRHELVHAFLFESGLGADSWGINEEIVDWIAYQFPKMAAAFEKVGAT
jgi:hypothetical protein